MSDDNNKRTMLGISPFRMDDDVDDEIVEPVPSATGNRPAVAPVSLDDDAGWDMPDVPLTASQSPVAVAASPAPLPPEDDLRGGTLMLSAAEFQKALADSIAQSGGPAPATTAEPAAPAAAPSSPEPAPAASFAPSAEADPEAPTAAGPGIPINPTTAAEHGVDLEAARRGGTVRLSAVDFQQLVTTGGYDPGGTTVPDAGAKHAVGGADLTDARVEIPARPPRVEPGPEAPQPGSVAARVADRRAAERNATASPAPTRSASTALVVVALCLGVLVIAGLLWAFVFSA